MTAHLTLFSVTIAVIGAGYVGLVTATCFAEVGHSVICVDIDETKINALKNGHIPFYEPGLQEILTQAIHQGHLKFTTDSRAAIQSSEIVFSAVGTPFAENEAHVSDLNSVKQVARTFGESLNGYKVFVIKSTVPVGTSEEVKKEIGEHNHSFDVVSNPEFLREGNAVHDFMKPSRILVGLDSQSLTQDKLKTLMQTLYEPFTTNGAPLLFTDLRSAEIIKYASNSFLATKISFINEIAQFCDLVGGDVNEVAKGLGLDERIGPHFLNAGVGYGGSCFPKDVKAFIETAKTTGCEFKILPAVDQVNERQRHRMVEKIQSAVGDLNGKTVALWGLSFKPGTDDLREAPSLDIIHHLIKRGASVRAFDPVAMKLAKTLFPDLPITYGEDAYDVCSNADVLALVTEWDLFKAPDFKRLKSTMNTPIIVDGRNVYNRSMLEAEGFQYVAFGR